MPNNPPEWQFWLSWLTQLFIGLSTFSAVLVALFGERLRHAFWPPKLKISLLNNKGEETYVNIGQETTKARWYHIKVENDRRWSAATEVQVYLISIEDINAKDQYIPVWDGGIPLKWRHGKGLSPVLARKIGPSHDADFLSIIKKPRDGTAQVKIETVLVPNNIANYVLIDKKCKLRFHMQARGVEVDSSTITIEVSWDGSWPDNAETLNKSLIVEQVG